MLVAVAVCLLVPVAAALALSGTFTGKSSQGKSARILISNNTVEMQSSVILWKARCHHGKHASTLTGYTDFGGALKGHSFHAHGSYLSYPGGPAEIVNTASVSFKIKGHAIKGTFTLKAKEYYEGHTPPTLLKTCKTGKVTFKAKS